MLTWVSRSAAASTSALNEFRSLAGTGLPVFMDSGAFSEVGFPGPYIKQEIKPRDWRARLNGYHLLSQDLKDQLYLVAPDRVGDQDHTLRLLRQYLWDIRELSKHSNVLVPLQNGRLEHAQMHRDVDELGFPWVPAIPSKHAATPTDQVARYCREIQPSMLHLLGMGPGNRRLDEVLTAIWTESPDTQVILHDSFLIRSKAGRTNGRGGGPRPYTAASDEAEAELLAEGEHEPGSKPFTYEKKRRAVVKTFAPLAEELKERQKVWRRFVPRRRGNRKLQLKLKVAS